MYRGKFAFQNWLVGPACSGKEIYHFALFYFVFEGKFQVQAPRGRVVTKISSCRVFIVSSRGSRKQS